VTLHRQNLQFFQPQFFAAVSSNIGLTGQPGQETGLPFEGIFSYNEVAPEEITLPVVTSHDNS
jgi:hypothetical protein